MKLRIQSKAKRQQLDLADEATLKDLIDKVESYFDCAKFTIRVGFPPKLIDLSNPQSTLNELGIRSGESLQIEIPDGPGEAQTPGKTKRESSDSIAVLNEKSSTARKKQVLQGNFSFSGQETRIAKPKSDDLSAPPEIQVEGQGVMTLRVQPDDNSCLFRAVGYLCMRSVDAMEELRSLIAATIQAQPEVYSDAVLGMKRDTYCAKMNRADTWGGEIEMKILSDHFRVQIASIDCKTGHIYRYGENFDLTIWLLYSGIHYDAIAVAPMADAPAEWDQTQFPSHNPVIEVAALKLTAILRARNYYTDTANFALRCLDCGSGLVGEKEAQDHAKNTGHVNFGEFKG